MFARMVTGRFKPGKFDFATGLMEKEVIPLLKKQPGFRDEVSFYDRDSSEGYAISFWNEKADLDRYEKQVYPKVREKMAGTLEGNPSIRKFEVANSTWYHIHAL